MLLVYQWRKRQSLQKRHKVDGLGEGLSDSDRPGKPHCRDGSTLDAVSALVDISFILHGNRGLLLCADRADTGFEGKRKAERQSG